MSKFQFRNKTIYYTLDGEDTKPKVLILNGIMMSTRSWDPLMKHLLDHFCVLRVDFLDQGLSDRMDQPYDQSLQVEMLNALLASLDISSIHVVGISYGGEVALQLASRFQDKVKRLMIFHSCAYTSPLLKDVGRAWMKAGEKRDGSLYYKVTIPTIYSAQFYEKHIDWMKQREKLLTPYFSDADFLDAMERLTASAENYDVRNQLETIDNETMVITAEEDALTPRKDQAYLVKHLKHAHWVSLPGVGHASMYESPLIFVTLIIGFLLANDGIINI